MHQVVIIYQNFRYILGLLARNLIPVSGHNDEQSSTSGQDYASDRSVIGAGRIAVRQLPSNQRGIPCCLYVASMSISRFWHYQQLMLQLQMVIWKLAPSIHVLPMHVDVVVSSEVYIYLSRFIDPSCNPHLSLMSMYRKNIKLASFN